MYSLLGLQTHLQSTFAVNTPVNDAAIARSTVQDPMQPYLSVPDGRSLFILPFVCRCMWYSIASSSTYTGNGI